MTPLVKDSIEVRNRVHRRLEGEVMRLAKIGNSSDLVGGACRLVGNSSKLVKDSGEQQLGKGGRIRSPCQAHAFQRILENRIFRQLKYSSE